MENRNITITMLGTGSALVTRCYNTCFVLDAGEGRMLVDAGGGNGVLAQLEKAKIDIRSIHYAFITHGHTDHILGMIWIVRKIAQMMHSGIYDGDFALYGHDEAIGMLDTFCKMSIPQKFYKYVGSRIAFKVVDDRQQWNCVGCHFTAFDIMSKKTKQYGFSAILPDGRKLVCLGDEPYNPIVGDVACDADWLMSEAFCLYAQRDVYKPYEKYHSTALDAGRVAEELHAKNLLLYHTEDDNLNVRAQIYAKEAAQNFSGNIVVPDDLQTVVL